MQDIYLQEGRIATVVTNLEMHAPPKLTSLAPYPLHLSRLINIEPEQYRDLFKKVGKHWLWFSRLIIEDSALLEIIRRDDVEIYAALDQQGTEVGLVELDFRAPCKTEIKFFGLIPELIGKGYGGSLMAQTLALAWRENTNVVWLHTCTLDHPAALTFYVKHGFRPAGQEIETFPDPRLTGILPQDAAPHIPLLTERTRDSSPLLTKQDDRALDLG